MRSFIVVGDLLAQRVYLAEFIKDRSIPRVGVLEYPETLKIADVRAIKAQLSRHGGIRLFVFYASATIAAQNAMLKSLEELPEDTFVIFFVKRVSDLLLTVQSRTTIVRLGSSSYDVTASFTSDVRVDFSSEESLLVYLQMASHSLRLGQGLRHKVLSDLAEVYKILLLVQNNNLSPKMASDYVLFRGLKLWS